jgi:hypothetical protein
MVGSRTCSHRLANGQQCRATPMREGEFCFWHDPEQQEAAAEARRLGGQRRRREKVVSGAYDFEGLGSVESIRRLIEVAAVDTLQLENSVARNRTLAYLAQTGAKLLEVGEFETRLEALEAALGPRLEALNGNGRR